MKKILFYYPANTKTVALETLIKETKDNGYNIEVLTLSQVGRFHEKLTELGIKWTIYPFERSNSPFYYLRQLIFLYKFCRENKFDVIWSHLQPCNWAASIINYLVDARTVIFRHHFHASIKKEGLQSVNRNERFFEWLTCKLARELVVPSSEVYNGMVNYEDVPREKIEIIPYIYDFNYYKKPDRKEVASIQNQHACQLLIIMVARLIPMKRHRLVFPVFKKMIEEGYDIKVMVMDRGEEKEWLEDYVVKNNLEERILFKGFVRNIIDYMAASDVMVHPSFTDASSSALKEMGLLRKPVMVCQGVGDVDEYIRHNKNGWVVQEESEVNQFEQFLIDAYENPEKRTQMGLALQKIVLDKFSAKPDTFRLYEEKLR